MNQKCRLLPEIHKFQNKATSLSSDTEIAKIFLKIAKKFTESNFGFVSEISDSQFLNTIAISNSAWEFDKVLPDDLRNIKGIKINGIYEDVIKQLSSKISNNTSEEQLRIHLPVEYPDLKTMLAVPIMYKENVFGIFVLGNKVDGYSNTDMENIEIFVAIFIQTFISKRKEAKLNKSKNNFELMMKLRSSDLSINDNEEKPELFSEKEKHFRQLFENTPFGMYWSNSAGEIIMANTALIKILGYGSLSELIKNNNLENLYLNKKDYHRFYEILATEGIIFKYETNLKHKNGEIITVLISANLLNDIEYDEIYEGIIEDITDKKKAEYNVAKLMIELKERIKELQCMNQLTDSIRKRDSFEKIFQDTCELLPLNWQYPEITRGKVIYDGKEYVSEPFNETGWKLSSEIVVHGKSRGSVEIFYVEEPQQLNGSVFKNEEHKLIDSLANTIGEAIEHFQARKTLEKKEDQYRALFENSPVPLWEEDLSALKKDIDLLKKEGITDFRKYFNDNPKKIAEYIKATKIIEVNNAAIKLHEAKSKDQLLLGLHVKFTEESIENFKEELIALTEGKSKFEYETIVKTLTGKEKYVQVNWEIVPGHEETFEKIYVSTIEITKCKYAEIGLKNLSTAIQQSPVSVVITNLNGNIEYVNKKFTEITGYSYEEVMNQNPRVLNSGEQPKKFYKELWKTILSGNNWAGEFLNKKKDGELFWEYAIISPVKNEKGKIIHYVAVKEDITERKIVQTQLIEAKEKAEKSDKLKSEFLTQISHEIRTPVNTILNFSQLIKNVLIENPSKDLLSCLESIEAGGKRLTRTIDLMVKISEIHTDNYEPEFKDYDIGDILEETLADHKKNALKKNIELIFIKKTNSSITMVDRLTIIDIFNNLIDNAIKFTDKGTVKVYLEKTITNKISVSIQDSGIGISEHYLRNIFSPFSQESGGYSRKFDGNGLGLNLVKHYCKLNHVEIIVHSQKMLGSNFTLYFS